MKGLALSGRDATKERRERGCEMRKRRVRAAFALSGFGIASAIASKILLPRNSTRAPLDRKYLNGANSYYAFIFVASNYWSSTEYNTNNAWKQNFSDGTPNNNNKNNSNYVRCVRSLLGNNKRRRGACKRPPRALFYHLSFPFFLCHSCLLCHSCESRNPGVRGRNVNY